MAKNTPSAVALIRPCGAVRYLENLRCQHLREGISAPKLRPEALSAFGVLLGNERRIINGPKYEPN